MKIKSFGCSFVFGSDLEDEHRFESYTEYSRSTWPALLAGDLDMDYECYAMPGIGNFRILCEIINQASLDDEAIFVINWTWIDRYDFVNNLEQWQTILPTENCIQSKFYFRHLHSHFKDLLTSVYHMNAAIDFLNDRKMPFVMSNMDYNILQPINPSWHDPRYFETIQKKVTTCLVDFDGKNFLDWSRDQGFVISEAWHPLKDAHRAAADKMRPLIDAILHRA